MGLLINGQWHDKWYDTASHQGEFKREEAKLRHWVRHDGSAGPSGDAGFEAQAGRYHLYVSLACPWAHRTLIFRQLKGLTDLISVSVVSPDMLEKGWSFATDNHSSGDALFQFDNLFQLYCKNNPAHSGRVTVPVLWDKVKNCIVSNESSEIIRMFNSAFDHLTGNKLNFYPDNLAGEIDTINEFIYHNINNGVYRCGFATTQQAYEQAFDALFNALDKVEERLSSQRYLCGNVITEADWRLFTTLIRFDAVYVGHFKCNLRTIESYPHLSAYTRELFQIDGVAETVDFYHIKRHYYFSHAHINPTQVVPKGPEIDYFKAHHRDELIG
ncbi:glutathione S-transferase family protein [Pseudoalteromonas tunicata]|uniref:glutathione S-transferase family protein n=1 Tax=Pseudoalteromonas tunicata TaxID=314281 RepID=UPI00273E42B0|nr:glutathione S-transferase family protein [Pseudoalteromonas tunicata]MDP5215226.1 glutathione S-transferase family protein [Pseudoalteromonas tunicata]